MRAPRAHLDPARTLGWIKPGAKELQPAFALLASALVFRSLRGLKGWTTLVTGIVAFLILSAIGWVLTGSSDTRSAGLFCFVLAVGLSAPLHRQAAAEEKDASPTRPGLLGFAVLAILTTAFMQWSQRRPLEELTRTAMATLVERLQSASEDARQPTHIGGLTLESPQARMVQSLGIEPFSGTTPLAHGQEGTEWRIWWWSDAKATPSGKLMPASLVRMIEAPIAAPQSLRLEGPAEDPVPCTSLRDEPKFEWSIPTPAEGHAVSFRFLGIGTPRDATLPQWHEVRLHEGQLTTRTVGDRTHYAWRPSWRSDVGQTVERELLWAEEELTQRGTTLHWTILCTDIQAEHPVRMARGRSLPLLP